VIGQFIKKEGTHVVLKEADINEHLSESEQKIFELLYEKVIKGRKSLGKPENAYYVVNVTEPYADKILEVIKEGEMVKVDPNQISLFDQKD
jgi:hypothetical protein